MSIREIIKAIESSDKTSRKERQRRAAAAINTIHNLWTVRIQEIMNEDECSPVEAFEKLREETRAGYDQTPPQCRAQYKHAWNTFKQKVNQCKK